MSVKDHRNAVFIGGGNDFIITDRTAGWIRDFRPEYTRLITAAPIPDQSYFSFRILWRLGFHELGDLPANSASARFLLSRLAFREPRAVQLRSPYPGSCLEPAGRVNAF
ncbi:hypothetical protein KCP73_10610 [Salmonella enterica subsp. enterica]|nr:hypothetical protein KCP73_10610 [Salmonella enterica subsp. enterica]